MIGLLGGGGGWRQTGGTFFSTPFVLSTVLLDLGREATEVDFSRKDYDGKEKDVMKRHSTRQVRGLPILLTTLKKPKGLKAKDSVIIIIHS